MGKYHRVAGRACTVHQLLDLGVNDGDRCHFHRD